MKKLRNYAGIGVCIALITTIYLRSTLHENNPYNYSSKTGTAEKYQISFKDVNDEFGFHLVHKPTYPVPKTFNREGNGELEVYYAMTSSMAVTSLNNDEYPDLCVTLPEEENGVRCFLNNGGKSFTEVTKEVGLDQYTPYLPQAVLSADFTNDGLEDLLVVRYGGHSIFQKTPEGKFVEIKNDWFSNSWGANIYDLNSDGKLDIMFANFYRPDDLTQNHIYWPWTGPSDDKNGAQNELWLNQSEGKFERDTKIYSATFKARTTSIGFADIDKDNRVEMFEGNDFAVDRFYSQDDYGYLVEKTATHMAFNHHGFSGMNTEFHDINHDGYLDLNVSNIVAPPYKGQKNLMWVWNKEDKRFEEESQSYGIDRCGFAWTGKFADFNLDGESDLILASGYHTKGDLKMSLNYLRAAREATPMWWPKQYVPRKVEDLSLVANSRPCLFMREGESFMDIGETFKELKNVATRNLVTADFNNDGKMDVIFGVQDGPLRMYRNESQTKDRNWIGFEFFHKTGSRVNFGVKATLKDEAGNMIEYFEFNPANGFRTQNDYRKLIGLGQKNKKMSLTIHGLGNISGEITYDDLRLNAYNKIQIN
jgi:hypothetical protein